MTVALPVLLMLLLTLHVLLSFSRGKSQDERRDGSRLMRRTRVTSARLERRLLSSVTCLLPGLACRRRAWLTLCLLLLSVCAGDVNDFINCFQRNFYATSLSVSLSLTPVSSVSCLRQILRLLRLLPRVTVDVYGYAFLSHFLQVFLFCMLVCSLFCVC